MNYATKKLKFIAYLIDFSLIGFIVGLSLLWVYLGMVIMPLWAIILLTAFTWYILYTILQALTFYIFKGRSLGTLIAGIKVTTNEDKRLSFSKCIIRTSQEAIFVFEIFSFFYCVKKNMHISLIDLLSETYMVMINE